MTKSVSMLVCAISLALAGFAHAAEVTVITNVGGPEGPLFVDGMLYYVGWTSNTLSRWDGKTSTVLNDAPGCGHNGLALTGRRTFLIACTNDPGAIIETDLTGKQVRKWETDASGAKLEGGVNDIVVAADGGAYATIFGPYVGPVPTGVIGRILYLAPGSDRWVEVANDLNYANGIGISRDQKSLYVSETVGNCILKFSIEAGGALSHRSNFALLNLVVKNPTDSWWLGPDSMKVDSKGDIYVAQWFGGRILKLSPEGKLLHVFRIAAGMGTTNVAFGEGEKELYVTVVKNPADAKAIGQVVRIPNVR